MYVYMYMTHMNVWLQEKLYKNIQEELGMGAPPEEALTAAFLTTDRDFLRKAEVRVCMSIQSILCGVFSCRDVVNLRCVCVHVYCMYV
jgi:hypothetical protein